jgi:2-oxoisovalerate ferredoxin oxidoreductase beta subunit
MTEPAELDPSVTAVGIPCTQIALDLGAVKVKNVVALGAMQAATGLLPAESMLTAIRDALKSNCAMLDLNEEAFSWGIKAFEEITAGVN